MATILAPQPAIILVRPQLGENIGKAARAMLNFGLTDLRLVAPRDGWPNPDAGPAAAGADAVLANARVYDSTAAAVADCAHVYATTVRRRGVTKPVVTPEIAAQQIMALPVQSGIIFGPERAGLEAEDVALARSILTIPINPDFGSLNLAQAVILVAYAWSRHQSLVSPSIVPIEAPALHADLEGMIGHFERLLDDANFYFPPARARVTRNNVRTMLTKPGWSEQEVRMMRGILTAIEKGRRASLPSEPE
jgi:tRNA/rRNA methyltransferase